MELENGQIDPAKLEAALPEMMGGCTPRAIREHLGLNKPIYARTSAYGHFGRTPDADGGFSWEKTDLVDQDQGPRLRLKAGVRFARSPVVYAHAHV